MPWQQHSFGRDRQCINYLLRNSRQEEAQCTPACFVHADKKSAYGYPTDSMGRMLAQIENNDDVV